MPDRLFPERLVAFSARHHRRILQVTSALLLASGISLAALRLDMDVLSQLPSRSQVFRDYRTFLASFGAYDSLVVLVTGDGPSIVSFADALAEKLDEMPEVGTVHYRIDLDDVRRRFLEPHRYELVPEDSADEVAARLEPRAVEDRVAGLRRALSMPGSVGARSWIVEDPLGVSEIVARGIERRYADPLFRPSSEYFLAPSGDALLMVVRPIAGAFDTIFTERLLTKISAAEGELLNGRFRGAGIEVGHTGSYVYALADKNVLSSDFAIYFVVAPLSVLAIFHLGLRTLRILPFVIFPLLVATALTFALSLLVFRSLNMVSVAFAGIFYGLGIDSSIYFYGLLRDKAARRPLDSDGLRRAVTETLRELGGANVVASTTTAVAFLVIGLSDFTGVAQLGLMTAVAMMLNVVATFVLLPAMVFAWGPRAIPERAAIPSRFAEAYSRLAVALARRRRVVLALSIAIVLAAALFISRVKLDTDVTRLRPGGGEAARVEELIRDRFGRVEAQATVLVSAGSAEESLRATERVSAALERLREQGLVGSVSTLAAFLPSRETAERRLARFRALPR
ncbi:MAG: MMPL family transporter, partial [Candidatus Binatia bacterium]